MSTQSINRFLALLLILPALAGLSTHSQAQSISQAQLISQEQPIAERPQVLASIKPIQLLVKAIAGDAIDVDLLLLPQQSPHHYQMRPSDRAKLDQAELIFWIGPGMETFMARSMLNLPAGQVKTLGKELPDTSNDHEHRDLKNDPHLWLDYLHIIQISAEIEKNLSKLLPEKQQYFSNNREQFIQQLSTIDQEASKKFALLSNKSFVMSHAAFLYLLDRYSLSNGIALSDTHGRVAGAKQWKIIDHYMQQQMPTCFLLDPSEQSAMQKTFLQRFTLTVASADTMGINISPTKNGFLTFYKKLTDDVAKCLSVEGKNNQ